jgi:hypothetical protein
MSELKATKGAWAVDSTNPCVVIDAEEGHVIAETGYQDRSIEEQHANAALIAAAPLLHDALVAILNDEGGSVDPLLFLAGYAACKKARGE